MCVDALRAAVYADVAELVDALASGASARKGVEVQVLLSAPIKDDLLEGRFLLRYTLKICKNLLIHVM